MSPANKGRTGSTVSGKQVKARTFNSGLSDKHANNTGSVMFTHQRLLFKRSAGHVCGLLCQFTVTFKSFMLHILMRNVSNELSMQYRTRETFDCTCTVNMHHYEIHVYTGKLVIGVQIFLPYQQYKTRFDLVASLYVFINIYSSCIHHTGRYSDYFVTILFFLIEPVYTCNPG